MDFPAVSFSLILPAIVLAVTGTVVMGATPFYARRRRHGLQWWALAGMAGAMLALFPMAGARGLWFADLWIVDNFSLFFHLVFLLIGAITVLTSANFLQREGIHHGEFYALLLFATAGMLMMAGSAELVMIFLGLEILSIATYVLAGFRRSDVRSNESALKYFLLGSFASAFFLYGVALIFGATGSTNLLVIGEALAAGDISLNLVYLSAALMLIGLCFKVALAPFHVWTPDVYEGAPTPVTGFMSVGPKAAGFAVLLRIFMTAFPAIQDRWLSVIWMVAALTMILGNVIAIAQPNIKRMLAYSSIAHAGFVAVAFAAGTAEGVSAALFYLLAYSLMSLGAFAIVTVLSRSEDKMVDIAQYAGLGAKRPGLAAALSVFLLSLAGIPGTAGFAGKFFVFRAAVESGLLWLVLIGVVTTVISFYYYLYVIVQMYMRAPQEEFADAQTSGMLNAALVIAAFGTIYLGILPTRALDWAGLAALF